MCSRWEKPSRTTASRRSVSPLLPTLMMARALARGSGDRASMFSVGVDHGWGPHWQQLGKEAQLGDEIGLHGRVVVQMIAAKVSESRSFQPYAVQAMLVEAVRG